MGSVVQDSCLSRPTISMLQTAQTLERIKKSPLLKSFLVGTFSGTCSTVLFQPLDLVKTRLQSPITIGAQPIGLTNLFVTIIREEKPQALWKGLVPSLARTVPGVGVYFTCLHALKSQFGSNDGHPSTLESLTLGACSRSLAGFCMLPITVVKTRVESSHFQYKSISQALSSIYAREGFKGLYSGLSATLLRDAPFSGLYLAFYNQSKMYAKKSDMFMEHQYPLVHFCCGVLAGCSAGVLTQPADVVKTRMQLYPDRFTTIAETAYYIYRHEGYTGFIRGIVPRTMRRTFMAAMAWTIYEQAMATAGLVDDKK